MRRRLEPPASVAQCSRLIAYRNDLTTGGPAWTVPGFWVPPVHLETNPLPHICLTPPYHSGNNPTNTAIASSLSFPCCNALKD